MTTTADTDAHQDRVLRITRRFDAAVETVFDAWTDPEKLACWWGPRGMTIPVCHIDLRVGGQWLTHMVNAQGGVHIVGGVYREIERPRRLAFTWSWRSDGTPSHETLVELDFVADGAGTELRLVQSLFESENARDLHNQGWTSALDCLADHLAGR